MLSFQDKINKAVNILLLSAVLLAPLAFRNINHNVVMIKDVIIYITITFVFFSWIIFSDKGLAFDRKVLSPPLIAYVSAVTLSSLTGGFWHGSLREYFRFIVYIMLFLSLGMRTGRALPASRVLNVLVFAGAGASLFGLYQFYLTHISHATLIFDRLSSTFGNPEFFGGFLVMVLPVSAVFFLISKNTVLKAVNLSCFALFLFNLVMTKARGGWLGFLAALVLFAALLYRRFPEKVAHVRLRYAAGAVIAAVILISLVSGTVSGRIRETLNFSRDTAGFRLYTWAATINYIRDYPLKGTGIGTFKLLYPNYRVPWIIEFESKHSSETDHAHNDFLEICADSGIAGLGLYLWLLAYMFKTGFAFIGRGDVPETDRLIMAGLVTSVFGVLVDNAFSVNMRYTSTGFTSWLLLGLIAGMAARKTPHAGAAGERRAFSLMLPGIAIAFFVVILSVKLFASDMHLKEGVNNSDMERWDAAMLHFRRAHELDNFNIMVRYFIGHTFSNKKQYAEAGEFYEGLLAYAPYYVQTNYRLGVINAQMGRETMSHRHFKRSWQLDPVYEKTYAKLGYSFVKLGMWDKALPWYRQAILRDRNNFSLHNDLGNIYYKLGKVDRAVAEYKYIISVDPANASAYNNIGSALLSSGRVAEASSYFSKALELDPNMLEAGNNMSMIRSMGARGTENENK